MGGLFGVIADDNCSKTLFYGTDYHSHLGTENAGMAVYGQEGFYKTIHSISQAQFKSRFVDDYKVMNGYIGIGAIDDDSPQPLIFRSKFGTFAIAASGLIENKEDLTEAMLAEGISFSERTGGKVNSGKITSFDLHRSFKPARAFSTPGLSTSPTIRKSETEGDMFLS